MSESNSKRLSSDEMESDYEAHRTALSREGYIKWRMGDVPAIYTAMMPPTYNAKYLWMAEKAIRQHMAEDQKLIDSPWRRVGPQPGTLTFSELTAAEKIEIAVEVECAPGLHDCPKPGREDEVQGFIDEAQRRLPKRKTMEERRAEELAAINAKNPELLAGQE